MKRKRTDPAIIRYGLYLCISILGVSGWQPNPWHRSKRGVMWLFGNGYRNTRIVQTGIVQTEAPCQYDICWRNVAPDRRARLLAVDCIWACAKHMSGHASISRENRFRVLPFLQAVAEDLWPEANIHTDGARWYTTRLAGGYAYAIMYTVLN